jgi:hypothetical protein
MIFWFLLIFQKPAGMWPKVDQIPGSSNIWNFTANHLADFK